MAGTSAVAVETRPGWRTTEFWVMVLVLVAGFIQQMLSVVAIPDRYVGLAQFVVAGLYIVSRGLAKAGVPNVVPETPSITSTSSAPTSERVA